MPQEAYLEIRLFLPVFIFQKYHQWAPSVPATRPAEVGSSAGPRGSQTSLPTLLPRPLAGGSGRGGVLSQPPQPDRACWGSPARAGAVAPGPRLRLLSSSVPAPGLKAAAPSVWSAEALFQESCVGRGGQEGVREERRGDSRCRRRGDAWAPRAGVTSWSKDDAHSVNVDWNLPWDASQALPPSRGVCVTSALPYGVQGARTSRGLRCIGRAPHSRTGQSCGLWLGPPHT